MNTQHYHSFRPLAWLPGGHAQTMADSFLPGLKQPYSAAPFAVTLSDGDRIMLHDDCPAGWRSGGPVALLVHGICGHHRSAHVVRAVTKLLPWGVRTFRMDLRGCGAGAGLARKPYHAGRSGDVAAALRALARICPDSPVSLIGFSLGGNLALKLAGEVGNRPPANLESVLAVCPPIDLAASAATLRRPLNHWLYGRHFLKTLARTVIQRYPHHARFASNPRCLRSFHEFVELYLAPVCGFTSGAEYYERCSSARLLSAIRVPTLVLASRDDPLVPPRVYEQARYSASTRLALLDHGGHLGFFGKSNPPDPDNDWLAWRILDWVAQFGNSYPTVEATRTDFTSSREEPSGAGFRPRIVQGHRLPRVAPY
jgi:predicted alpha/beta-fold hydrolase